jgi:cobalt-zinc-cadmium efflux system membrane fusion protein
MTLIHPGPRANQRLIVAAMLIATAAAALTACHRAPANAEARPMFTDEHGLITVPAGSPLRTHLAVQTVGGGVQPAVIELPAQVEADPARVANVPAPLAGRVVALKVGLGQRVRKGQVLAILASGDTAGAYSDRDKAADVVETARKALERAKGVKAAGGAAEKDLEAAQSAFNQAQAELSRAQTRIAALNGLAKGDTHDLVLTAPQTGVVITLAVGAGQQVTDPTAVLMTVANVDKVFVTANVPESQIGEFPAGAAASVVLAGDASHPLQGRVTEADAVVQPDTRRQKVRIAMANPGGRLLPNMYATVRLNGRVNGGVIVPQSALLMNNDVVSVLVEIRPWVFQRRAVRIGDETEADARVVSGLSPGDRVVVRGGVLLDD